MTITKSFNVENTKLFNNIVEEIFTEYGNCGLALTEEAVSVTVDGVKHIVTPLEGGAFELSVENGPCNFDVVAALSVATGNYQWNIAGETWRFMPTSKIVIRPLITVFGYLAATVMLGTIMYLAYKAYGDN